MDEVQLKAQLATLAAFPPALKAQLQGIGETALRFRPAPEEWSAVEVLGHLVEAEAMWLARIRQMLSTDNPKLAVLDNNLVRQRDYQNKQLGFLHITLAERREELLEQVRVLRPVQLARTGVHPTRGQLTIAEALAVLSGHDQMHQAQIEANLEAWKQQ